jgi:hypothetical protein
MARITAVYVWQSLPSSRPERTHQMDDLANHMNVGNNSIHSHTISHCDRRKHRAVFSSDWKLPRSRYFYPTFTSFRDLCIKPYSPVASFVLKVAISFYAETLGELQDTTKLNPKIIQTNKCLLHHTQMSRMFRKPFIITTLLNTISIRKYATWTWWSECSAAAS